MLTGLEVINNLIEEHEMPFHVFETGRTIERQKLLVEQRKERALITDLYFSLDKPIKLSTAIKIVYYKDHWSWDIRNSTIKAWYLLLGELTLDSTNDIGWGGTWRKHQDYTHFYVLPDLIKT